MMKQRGLYLLMLGFVLSLSSCRDSHKAAQATEELDEAGFYDAKAAEEAAAATAGSEAEAGAEKAKPQVTMMEIPAPLKNKPEMVLRRIGYTTSYNKTTKVPNWVAWHLTKSHTYGSHQRSQEVFAEDGSVPAPRATDADYYTSRYDRGHMCPAGDNKWDGRAMTESFLFTNICPQNHGLNKYEWNDVEMLCRDWARRYGSIDIVCGPIFYGQGEQKTIGRNKVWVPDAFFKVVLCRKGTPKAIGFIYKNRGVKQRMDEAVCTVDEVERITGIDFFPALADGIERRVEAEADLGEW